MLLTSNGFNPMSETKLTAKNEKSLPPLTHMNTPDRSVKMKTQTNQFYNDKEEGKIPSRQQSPKNKNFKTAEKPSRDTESKKSRVMNAEISKKIEEAKEAAFERIMHSANIVKEVLQRNMSLSEDIVKNHQIVDDLNQNVYQLQRENEDLRERLEILETITGKDSSSLLKKIRGMTKTDDDPEDTKETEEKPQEEVKDYNEKDLMVLLTNSDDFMVKNKQSVINAIYKLSKDKQILNKRIENLEKNRIRKTHMKLRMTNNHFYNQNGASEQKAKYKATLDEGVDDTEPIRSILNEEDLDISNQYIPPKIRKGNKLKLAKHTSMKDKRALKYQKRPSGTNQSSKSEIRIAHSFNYGPNFRRTRESFLEQDASGNGKILIQNDSSHKYGIQRHPSTQEEMKNRTNYSSGHQQTNLSTSSAIDFDQNVVQKGQKLSKLEKIPDPSITSETLYNQSRLKKSPYDIAGYDHLSRIQPRKGKLPSHSKKFRSKKKF